MTTDPRLVADLFGALNELDEAYDADPPEPDLAADAVEAVFQAWRALKASVPADAPRPKTDQRWYADLRGEDGNAYVILGTVSRIIRETLGKDEAAEYRERATSGDYDNLLAVSREYVDIVERRSGYYEPIDRAAYDETDLEDDDND